MYVSGYECVVVFTLFVSIVYLVMFERDRAFTALVLFASAHHNKGFDFFESLNPTELCPKHCLSSLDLEEYDDS